MPIYFGITFLFGYKVPLTSLDANIYKFLPFSLPIGKSIPC